MRKRRSHALKQCSRSSYCSGFVNLGSFLATSNNNFYNHKNYNFLNCDWFKETLFPTDSLAKLLSDSLLSDSLISDSLLSDSSTNQSN